MSDYHKIQKIIIATIMREQGETGVQTHFNMLKKFVLEQEVKVCVITPFSFYQCLVLPVFALRKIIDILSGELSVWWYRYWHYFFLKQALKAELAEQAQKGIPVVIYAQCPLSAKAALEARTTENQKVIMAVHFNISQADEWANKGKIKIGSWVYHKIKALENEVIPLLDAIVYISGFMKETIEKNISKSTKVKSIVSPNFIFTPKPLDSNNIEGDLISIGTLEYRKNQSYLLRVLSEAKKMGRSYSLTLIGEGPDRRTLEALAQSLDVARQVKFLGFQKNAAQFLYTHRLYVHSSLIDNLPIALIEALACKLPILAGAVGGIPEMFSDGVEGFYWSLDDPAAGAKKLIALMEDKETYNKMAEAAKARFSANFQSSVVANRLLSFLCNQAFPNSGF
jgi:glycosyltransferase involved in cell wall biosynthesis